MADYSRQEYMIHVGNDEVFLRNTPMGCVIVRRETHSDPEQRLDDLLRTTGLVPLP